MQTFIAKKYVLSVLEKKDIAIISVDPSKRKTGGALLGDRIRMNSIRSPRVYMRSLATRQANLALSAHVNEAINVLKAANFDLIILETSGIGQSDTEIVEHSDIENIMKKEKLRFSIDSKLVKDIFNEFKFCFFVI